MSEGADTITRAEAVEIASEAAQAVARELRAELVLALTPLTPAAPAEDEASATAALALAAHALLRGDGSAAELHLAVRAVFGPHTGVVLDAVRSLGPRATPVTERTA